MIEIQERNIPAGKILIADYADAKGKMSQVTILDQTIDEANRVWKFKQHEPGFEPAGSMARWTNRKYSVTFFDYAMNAMFGQSFTSKDDAIKFFEAKKVSA